MWDDDETTDVMSAVELFDTIHESGVFDDEDLSMVTRKFPKTQALEIVEVSRGSWRVEASVGIHLECSSKDIAMEEMLELVGRGYKADLYAPNGKWVATSEGIKRS
jgi:hypothetical protein